MRVRIFELRLLAAALTVLWATAAALVLVGYRPGGPIDVVVGLAACLAVPIPLLALRWPPAARGPHAFAAIAWIGLGSALLLVPSIGGVVNQLVARGPQTLLPSLEFAYPWLLALVATALFAGLGVARRVLGETSLRRDRLAAGAGFALAVSAVVGSAFTAAALANDAALRDRPAVSSRFGPTTTAVEPQRCDAPLSAGPGALVSLGLTAVVDTHPLGSVELAGVRDGTDFRWNAQVATERLLGLYGAARKSGSAWTLEPRRQWQPAAIASADGLDLDAQIVRAALATRQRVAAEDRGVETIEGARSRHCRIAIDGPTFGAAFPAVAYFTGDGADLHRWRGELDYWVFLDGQVGRVSGSIDGPASSMGLPGVQSTLTVILDAIDRDAPITIVAPS
jgi:hypothetical protein